MELEVGLGESAAFEVGDGKVEGVQGAQPVAEHEFARTAQRWTPVEGDDADETSLKQVGVDLRHDPLELDRRKPAGAVGAHQTPCHLHDGEFAGQGPAFEHQVTRLRVTGFVRQVCPDDDAGVEEAEN